MKALSYVQAIRDAYVEGDLQLVEELKANYGNNPVAFKELEETYSYLLYNIAEAVGEVDSLHETRYNQLMGVLQSKQVVTPREVETLMGQDLETQRKILGERSFNE